MDKVLKEKKKEYKKLMNIINIALKYLNINYKYIDIINISNIYNKLDDAYDDFNFDNDIMPSREFSLSEVSEELFISPRRSINLETDKSRPYYSNACSKWEYYESPFVMAMRFGNFPPFKKIKRVNTPLLIKLLKQVKKDVNKTLAVTNFFDDKIKGDSNKRKTHQNRMNIIKKNHTTWNDLAKNQIRK